MTSWYGRIRCLIEAKVTRRSNCPTNSSRRCKAPAVRITRIADFPFEFPDSGVVLNFEVCGFGIRTVDRRIIVDPWLAFDQNRSQPDAADRWSRVSDRLQAADLAPDTVDTVVFTHLDGVGWAVSPDGETPSFANARHLVAAGELAAF